MNGVVASAFYLVPVFPLVWVLPNWVSLANSLLVINGGGGGVTYVFVIGRPTVTRA